MVGLLTCIAYVLSGHIVDAFKDWKVSFWGGKRLQRAYESFFLDLSWRRHLFRSERRARFYFRVFADHNKDFRIQ